MERGKADSMNNKDYNQDDFILVLNHFIQETNLNEFEELKESVDNIHSEANKMMKNKEEKKMEKENDH